MKEEKNGKLTHFILFIFSVLFFFISTWNILLHLFLFRKSNLKYPKNFDTRVYDK